MLRVSAVSKSFGGDAVLRDATFDLGKGRRAGLVGPNGSGKSTLLQILAGRQQPDSGSVWVDPHDAVAYLPQYPLDQLHLSLRQALLHGAGGLGELQQRLAQIEAAMAAASTNLDAVLSEYACVREEFERLGGYTLESSMERVIAGLALDALDLDAPVSSLSGGNKTKLSLARLLLSGATILLLDEPTNYLDLPALLWLEEFVVSNERSYVIVSHDRRFLDATVDSILELDPIEHRLRQWSGNYSDYAEAKRVEEDRQRQAYLDQQEEVARVKEDIRRTKEQARSTEARTVSGPGADQARRLAKKVAKKAKARERRLDRQLEENQIEKPRLSWNLHLADLGRDPIEDRRTVVAIEDLRAGYGDRPVLEGVDLRLQGTDRVALLGANGSGKSTIVRCIAGRLPYTGTIQVGPRVRMGVLWQEHEDLPLDSTVLDAFRSRTEMYESEARTYLHKFLFTGEEVLKPVRALSYGQRSKLALAVLVLSDANFLLLDEPTSHMDLPALDAIEQALAEYTGPLLVVSHDRYFLDRIGINRYQVMVDGALQPVAGLQEYERSLGYTAVRES